MVLENEGPYHPVLPMEWFEKRVKDDLKSKPLAVPIGFGPGGKLNIINFENPRTPHLLIKKDNNVWPKRLYEALVYFLKKVQGATIYDLNLDKPPENPDFLLVRDVRDGQRKKEELKNLLRKTPDHKLHILALVSPNEADSLSRLLNRVVVAKFDSVNPEGAKVFTFRVGETTLRIKCCDGIQLEAC